MSIANPPLSRAIASLQARRRILTLHRGAFRPRPPPAVACLVSSSSFNDAISLTASVGSPPEPSPIWKLDARHVFALNTIALAAAIASSWLFFSVIPSLLALKKAAESTEKLFDRKREELPDAMAAMRLSGAEISDLTMELSELGQDISQRIKNSTRFIRQISLPQFRTRSKEDRRASSGARNMREGIVKWRSAMSNLLALSRFSRQVLGFLATMRTRS